MQSSRISRIFDSSLTNLLKFDFPAVEDYMEFNLQSEADMIKAWIKDYNFGRRGAMLLNSLIKRVFTNLNKIILLIYIYIYIYMLRATNRSALSIDYAG